MPSQPKQPKKQPGEGGRRGSGSGGASPPMLIVQSFERMTPKARMRLRVGGALMLIASIMLPLVGGLFVELSAYYWIFSGFISLAGLCLLWPELGIWLVKAIPNALVKILPSKLLSRPDRRSNSEEE